MNTLSVFIFFLLHIFLSQSVMNLKLWQVCPGTNKKLQNLEKILQQTANDTIFILVFGANWACKFTV